METICKDNMTDNGLNESSTNEGRLRRTLYETIETLEETKKAFKSKRLEALRKKLIKVLMEHPSG